MTAVVLMVQTGACAWFRNREGDPPVLLDPLLVGRGEQDGTGRCGRIHELLLLLGLIGVKLALDLRTMAEERLALRTVLRLRDVRCLLIGLNQVDDIFGILG